MERRRSFLAVSVLFSAILLICVNHPVAQTIDVLPDEIPNGVLTPSTYRQRLDVLLNGPDNGLSRSFTITLPPEVTIVSGSATATSDASSLVAFVAGFPTSNQIAVGLTGTMSSRLVTIEFDARTPSSYTGISSGTALDTSYVFDFAAGFTNNNDLDAPVSLNQNKQIQFVTFSSPDPGGSTTPLGGRFYKMAFPSQFGPGDAFGLPDLAHSGLTGVSASRGFTDNQTDVSFSFFVASDPTLIQNNAMTPSGLFTIGADDVPLVGQRQNPRLIPTTFIREDFTSTFGDSTEALISMISTVHNGDVYIYVTSDLTDDWFIGRSGPLTTPHPPEFVIAGWDYDDDGGDDFNSTGLIQVPTELIGGGGQKDNNDITVDSGDYLARGTAVPQTGFITSPLTSIDMLFKVEDDQPGGVTVGVFLTLSSLADRVPSDLDPSNPGTVDSLRNSVTLVDTLTANDQLFSFPGLTRNATTGLVETFVDAGTYKVYFAAIDGDGNRTLYKVFQDPFANPATEALLTVGHSPSIQIDATQFNDLDGDGDLDVETGIGVSQMITSIDGRDLLIAPSTRIVPISWGRAGIDGDLDVDDSGATLDLYFSTRSDFNSTEGSVANTSGNSDGTDLLASVSQLNNDTHQIVSGLDLSADGRFDNLYNWDLWTYVSPEGTVPASDTRYYIYGILNGGSTSRLVSFTTAGAINFNHPPYLVVEEFSTIPLLDVNVGDPVLISWKAIDVDNGYSPSDALPGGLSAPNDRSNSPNIRILLTSADLGEVTTWGSITAASEPLWVGNSTDGALAGEVELNEGVDTSFVIIGNRMIDNLEGGQGLKIAQTLNVYVAIDGNGEGDQPSQFDARSPVVKAPNQIRFSGTEPTTAPTAVLEFIVPDGRQVTVGENFQWTIIPNVPAATGAVEVVNLYITADATQFTPIDVDTVSAGIQPFTIGTPEFVSSSLVFQGTYLDPGVADTWRMDFTFTDVGGGLTFFDGVRPLAILNLNVIGSAGTSDITLDRTSSRESKMRIATGELIPSPVLPSTMTIIDRASVSGFVRLQKRDVVEHPSGDNQITFFLRQPGSLSSYTDALFAIQDEDVTQDGIQHTTTGLTGVFSLDNVPPGRWVLTASFPRYLTGHDTILVVGGTDLTLIEPARLGDGVLALLSELPGGDVAGYNDASGDSVPDNFIGPEDISAVTAALFAVLRVADQDLNYNTYADINGDSIVNAVDMNMSTNNQTTLIQEPGKLIPVLPTFKQAVLTGDNSKAVLRVTGYPAREVKPGEMFDLTIGIEGARALRTYELHLEFDPQVVAVVDLVSNGDLFKDYTTNMGGKLEPGKVGLVNSIVGRTEIGASGAGSLATIRFQAVGRAVETAFIVTEGILIDIEHEGAKPQTGDPVMITLSKDPIVYHDADGGDVLGLILANEDPVVGFNDFVAFAGAFNSLFGDPAYDFRADLNGDDAIDFADFLIFSTHFGRVAVDVPPSLSRTKRAVGSNGASSIHLELAGSARFGESLTLEARITDAQALQGWGFEVTYDPGRYEFLSAEAPGDNLFESVGADAPLFLVKEEKNGVVRLASAVSGGTAPSGEGAVARLVFRPIGDVETGWFEITDGVVFDPNLLQNTIPRGQKLEVRAVPSSFALIQNFPNPFNPETTISYDLADGGRVELEIYNVMGQNIKQLVNEEQAAGRYRVVWDGSDAIGRQVASGVYFYSLNTTQFNAVRKLMLLK